MKVLGRYSEHNFISKILFILALKWNRYSENSFIFSLKRKLKRGEELFSENNLRADAIFAQASDFIGYDWLKKNLTAFFYRLLIYDRGVA